MLGLASSTTAILAGDVAASNDAMVCSTPSSKTRKSFWPRPHTRVPSGNATEQFTETSATRERIVGIALAVPPASFTVPECSSPVAGSRPSGTDFSRTLGLGRRAFCDLFCAGRNGLARRIVATSVAKRRLMLDRRRERGGRCRNCVANVLYCNESVDTKLQFRANDYPSTGISL